MVESKKISVTLKKQGRESKQKLFTDIAKRIIKPKRRLARVNLWKLNNIAKKQKGKIFIVPGSVLGTGKIESEIKVAALRFSKTAKEKIKNAKGNTFTLEEIAKEKQKKDSMVIIK